jgi:predicted phage terminase large subunit-like protein
MTTIKKEKIKEMLKIRKMRYFICKQSLWVFGLYYFTHYFFMPSAPFHKEMAEDAMFKDNHKFLYWIMFGESAKTTWAKIKVIHSIVYGLKKNIGWVNQDLKKASRQVMSIASELKGNKKIIQDFGHLFWEAPEMLKKKSRSKTFSEFMTANDVFIKAISTQVSQRGEVQDQFRPDLYIIDDIENDRTVRSIAITESVIIFLQELFRGIAVDCDILILSNRIAKNGSVAWLEKHLDDNPKALIHEVKIYDKKGKITWPSRFVETTKEAEKINSKQRNKKRHVKSLEQMRYDMGSTRFKVEMMNEPIDNAGSPVKFEWVRREPQPDIETLEMGIACDPAISEKTTADYFSLCGGGRHKESGKIYITKSYKTRCNITEQVNLCVNWHRLYPKAWFRIETVAYQKALAQLLSNKRREDMYIPITEFKPDTDKLRRLQAIVPFIERGDIVFCEGREIDELVASLLAFPFAEHDDDVDAFISVVEGFIQRKKIPGLMVS